MSRFVVFDVETPISAGILLCYIPIIVVRIRNEEMVLAEGLPGYAAYCKKVKYRILPLIW